MNLLVSLRSEILKTKRTAAFYFTLVGAAIVPAIFLLNVLTDGLPDEKQSSKDPLNAIFNLGCEINSLAIFPLFLVLICTLLPQIEHKNNTWKQVLTSPQTKANVFTAKFLNVHLLILVFLIANHLFMWIVAIGAHLAIPQLNILHQPLNGKTILINTANLYVAVLAICAIQFWIGLRIKNFIVPIAVGIAMWLTGTILSLEYHSSLANYFPYSFQLFPMSPQYKPDLAQVVWTSAGYAAVILLLGFLDFRRRRMTA